MNNSLRIVFVGCVEEGRECLQEILEVSGQVVGILTFTDEIAQKTSGAVDFEPISRRHNIPLHKVANTNTAEAIELIKQLRPDVIFVIGWTRLVCKEILEIPRYGCIGMHASLLPSYRGRAPVNWTLIHDGKESGNTSILLDEGVDTGKMLAQDAFPISMADTCQTVYHKVAFAGRNMIRRILSELEHGRLPSIEANGREASVMPKRRPQDGLIEWNQPAMTLFNWVRALTHPYPGAFTILGERQVFIWEARIAHYPGMGIAEYAGLRDIEPGTILAIDDGIAVLCGGQELLTLHRLGFSSAEDLGWQGFLKSAGLKIGDLLG